MSKIKVLIVTGKLPHYRIPIFNNLAEQEGIDLTIAHAGKESDKSIIVFKEVIVKEYHFGPISIHDKGFYKFCGQHDVVIAMFYIQKLSFLKLALKVNRKFKLIYWGHGLGKSPFTNLLRKMISNRVDAFLVYDAKGKSNLNGLGIPAERIFIANNTVHVSNFQDTSDHTKDIFLYVGRLQKRKELSLALHAFKNSIVPNYKRVRMVIIGNGGIEKQNLIQIAKELKISDRVEFIEGTTDQEILLSYFSRSYAYVSLGHVGLGVLHSFAYGVPVLTLKNRDHAPEFSNIIDEVNGYIIIDEQDVGQKMKEIVISKNRNKIGFNAFIHYNSNRRVENMVEGFKEAISYVTKCSSVNK